MKGDEWDVVDSPVNVKFKKEKDGWSVKAQIPVSVFGYSCKKAAVKALDKLIREMTGCNFKCGCEPLGKLLGLDK